MYQKRRLITGVPIRASEPLFDKWAIEIVHTSLSTLEETFGGSLQEDWEIRWPITWFIVRDPSVGLEITPWLRRTDPKWPWWRFVKRSLLVRQHQPAILRPITQTALWC